MKNRIEKAILAHAKRNQPFKPKRKQSAKNDSPEKRVEREVTEWMTANGFKFTVIESKAVYSQSAGRYLRSQADVGCPDILGITAQGLGAAVELKAPGKRKNLSVGQHDFLAAWIEQFAFSVVVTSANELQHLYSNFLALERNEAREFLRSHLPRPSSLGKLESSEGPLFD